MKAMLWILVLIGLIGALVWKMGYFEVKKVPEQSVETVSAKTEKTEKTDAAQKAKLEAEAKAQKESAEKKAQEEAKAQLEKKIAELQQMYDEKKTAFLKLKEEKNKLTGALAELEKKAPEFVAVSGEYQKKAQDTSSQIRSFEEKLAKQAQAVAKAQKDFAQSDCVVLGSREKKDRTGWYYVSTPGDIRPLSELGRRNRSKAIKYVYKEDTTKSNSISQAKDELERQRGIMKEMKQQLSVLKADYEKLKISYQNFIKSKLDSIASEMNEAKESGKKLDSELKTLKNPDGKIS